MRIRNRQLNKKTDTLDRLESYGVLTFQNLSQCTYQFLSRTAGFSPFVIENLRGFLSALPVDERLPAFPLETADNIEGVAFRRKYPFNTHQFPPVLSIASELEQQGITTLRQFASTPKYQGSFAPVIAGIPNLERYDITKFNQLSLCTYKFLNMTVGIPSWTVKMLEAFFPPSATSKQPVKTFPLESPGKLKNKAFLTKYPLNTKNHPPSTTELRDWVAEWFAALMDHLV